MEEEDGFQKIESLVWDDSVKHLEKLYKEYPSESECFALENDRVVAKVDLPARMTLMELVETDMSSLASYVRCSNESFNAKLIPLVLDGKKRVFVELLEDLQEGKEVVIQQPISKESVPLVLVKRVNDEEKPYFGQRGLFASSFIGHGEIVSEYLGLVRMADASIRSEYVVIFPNSFAEDQTYHVRIDAWKMGNESRFINHSEDENNCEFNWRWIKGELRLLIVAIRDIQEGEEILVDYGNGFFKKR